MDLSPHLVIKNTFIAVRPEDLCPALRRCHSAPALCVKEDEAPDAEAEENEKWCSECNAGVGQFGTWTDDCASTVASFPACEEYTSGTEEEDYGSESAPGSTPKATLSLVDLLPLQKVQRSRTLLRKSAKVYVPPATQNQTGFTLGLAPQVRQGFAEVLAAGKSALTQAGGVGDSGPFHHVEAAEANGGWTLRAHMQPPLKDSVAFSNADKVKARSALAAAKEAILASAEHSESVYVLGYEVTPFRENFATSGFSCDLAYIEDEDTACWDLITTGVCAKGSACRFQHDCPHACVRVALVPSSP